MLLLYFVGGGGGGKNVDNISVEAWTISRKTNEDVKRWLRCF